MQDFDPAVQRAINRIQDFDTTARCVDLLRGDGIEKLSIDLIYGLPHQTVAGLSDTIEQVLTLGPDRLAIFGYAHVPGFKKHQALIPQAALPGVKDRFAQAESARARLLAAGYAAIGLDHFARPGDPMAIAKTEGTLARNFQGYTTDTAPALIGFGASSIGALPQGYVQNQTGVPAWRAAILADALPVARGVALSDEDRLRREVIERLMCDLEVDLAAVARRHGRAPVLFADALEALHRPRPRRHRGGQGLAGPRAGRRARRGPSRLRRLRHLSGPGRHALHRGLKSLAQVFQDLARRVVARRAGHAAAGMRAGAAHVETFDRAAVIAVPPAPAAPRTSDQARACHA